MKVIIFGGTGSVGTLVVDQALEQEHEVTVVTRDRAKVERDDPGLRVVEGDVFDARSLAPAIAGQDAVIVTLGAGGKGGVRGPGTAAVIQACRTPAYVG
jgi:uncharacterized protein YbjT (DUF2867 family)